MTLDFGLRHLSGAQVAQSGKVEQTDLRHCATTPYRGGVVERSRVVVKTGGLGARVCRQDMIKRARHRDASGLRWTSSQVALGPSPRRSFECPCQGYATDDPGEPYPDDV